MNESVHFAKQVGKMLHERLMAIEQQHPELFHAFLSKRFTAAETGVHPRVLADWNKRGLLLAPRKENKHHRLSLTEFVWILMLEKMRSFGITYNIIKAFKDEWLSPEELDVQAILSSPELLEAITSMLGESAAKTLEVFVEEPGAKAYLKNFVPTTSVLQGVLMHSYFTSERMNFLIDGNGAARVFWPELLSNDLVNPKELEDALYSTHFSINVSEILGPGDGKVPMEKVSGELKLLSEEEAAVIRAVRSERVKSVSVRFDELGEMTLLELTTTERAENATRLIDLMVRNAYQDIIVKTENGKVVHCEKTRKFKLK